MSLTRYVSEIKPKEGDPPSKLKSYAWDKMNGSVSIKAIVRQENGNPGSYLARLSHDLVQHYFLDLYLSGSVLSNSARPLTTLIPSGKEMAVISLSVNDTHLVMLSNSTHQFVAQMTYRSTINVYNIQSTPSLVKETIFREEFYRICLSKDNHIIAIDYNELINVFDIEGKLVRRFSSIHPFSRSRMLKLNQRSLSMSVNSRNEIILIASITMKSMPPAQILIIMSLDGELISKFNLGNSSDEIVSISESNVIYRPEGSLCEYGYKPELELRLIASDLIAPGEITAITIDPVDNLIIQDRTNKILIVNAQLQLLKIINFGVNKLRSCPLVVSERGLIFIPMDQNRVLVLH